MLKAGAGGVDQRIAETKMKTLDRGKRTNSRRSCMIALAATVACVAMFAASCSKEQPAAKEQPIAPPGCSVVCKLFLGKDAASEEFYGVVMRLKETHGHELHLLCFQTGPEPVDATRLEMARGGVTQVPCALFDGYWAVTEPSEAALQRALEACLKKPEPKLSMELHGGIIAKTNLSLTFLVCNHVSKLDFDGIVQVYVYEHGVSVGSWECDFAFRKLLETQPDYRITAGKCQQPMILTWRLPDEVDPANVRVLALVYDSAHKLLDSICSDKGCTRTGVCG